MSERVTTEQADKRFTVGDFAAVITKEMDRCKDLPLKDGILVAAVRCMGLHAEQVLILRAERDALRAELTASNIYKAEYLAADEAMGDGPSTKNTLASNIKAIKADMADLRAERDALRANAVTLWTCPECAFGFDAQYHQDNHPGEYECPVCAETRLEKELTTLRAKAEALANLVQEEIDAHKPSEDNGSSHANDCEAAECAWCSDAEAALAAFREGK